MKTTIAAETVQALALELAFAESSRYDAAVADAKSALNYWEVKLYGLKTACNVVFGCWPASYMVSKYGYVVVDFEPTSMDSKGVEFHIDANTLDFIEF